MLSAVAFAKEHDVVPRIVTGILLCMGIVVGSAQLAVATAAPTLGARNIVAGSAPAMLDVIVPQTATLVTFPAPQLHGNGRIVGFVLRGADVVVLDESGPDCWTPGCARRNTFSSTISFPPEHQLSPGVAGVTLRPGPYQLYLITDGAPLDVELPLRGLNGSTRLVPNRPIDLDMRTIAPTMVGTPLSGTLVYSGGATGHVATDAGLVHEAMSALIGNQQAVGSQGTCLYHAPPPGNLYLPGCPVQQPGSIFTVTKSGTGPGPWFTVTFTQLVQASRDGHEFSPGAWWDGVAPDTEFGQVIFWLDFMPLASGDGGPDVMALPGTTAGAGWVSPFLAAPVCAGLVVTMRKSGRKRKRDNRDFTTSDGLPRTSAAAASAATSRP